MSYQNSQWAVTEYGLETVAPEARYEIEASRLTETTKRGDDTFYEWPVHLAEKEWVDLGAFIQAFEKALELHKDRYSLNLDTEMLEASKKMASCIAKKR